ncbi:MAG: S8 family peptidase [Pseudomonadota bacterium]
MPTHESHHPLLIFPAPGRPGSRQKRGGGAAKIHTPTAARQGERLTPRFQQLQDEIERRSLQLTGTITGHFPEQVLVFEIAGSIEQFVRAVESAQGLEWLAEELVDESMPDDDFYEEGSPQKPIDRRLYLIAATDTGLRQVLSMWRRYQEDRDFEYGMAAWRDVFAHLHDVRRWDHQDRLEATGVLEAWQSAVEFGWESVTTEVQLWYRRDERARRTATAELRRLAAQAGGVVLQGPIDIPDIGFHGFLLRLPTAAVRRILAEEEIALVEAECIHTFHVAAQAIVGGPGETERFDAPTGSLPQGAPVVALLDGLPVENHRLLLDRLVVDDPDGWAAVYPAAQRVHGTQMASAIIHGDLGAGPTAPLRRPVYVRPILRPVPVGMGRFEEGCPTDRMWLDLFHGAVVRMLDEQNGQAPEVRIINLSVGDESRPLERSTASALARLLDWFSWRYRVLFVVAAGNFREGQWEIPISPSTFDTDRPAREQAILEKMRDEAFNRRILSPAESINALTVGALHADASTTPEPTQLRMGPREPVEIGWPATYSRHGFGLRRSIKPDIVTHGGRELLRRRRDPLERIGAEPDHVEVDRVEGGPGAKFGIQVAAPPPKGLPDLSHVTWRHGTSHATALVSRAAAQIDQQLDELAQAEVGVDTIERAILLKALLVHSASWSDLDPVFEGLIPSDLDSRRRAEFKKTLASRWVGFGSLQMDRVLWCTDQRVTAIGGGEIRDGEARNFRFPLPESLRHQRGYFERRLTITLAWLTPINPSSQRYRGAHLWFSPVAVQGLSFGGQESDHNAVQRGTVQHVVYRGRGAARYTSGAAIEIQANCRGDSITPLDQPIPYAVAVTFEVGAEVETGIYQEVQQAIRPRIGVVPRL